MCSLNYFGMSEYIQWWYLSLSLSLSLSGRRSSITVCCRYVDRYINIRWQVVRDERILPRGSHCKKRFSSIDIPIPTEYNDMKFDSHLVGIICRTLASTCNCWYCKHSSFYIYIYCLTNRTRKKNPNNEQQNTHTYILYLR